ncbi:MAG: peptide MFS transporter [Ignavibacteriae bacterium]|nr:peptide MFS transporter [Ignavibacteriota bacterium]
MFKGHPKGLYVLALSNMGERFGYYTMLAIFTLFIEAKLGIPESEIGQVWGLFLAAVYGLPILGGLLADRLGYGKVVVTGMIVMFLGYVLLSYPAAGTPLLFTSLFVIALGTGFFKGNMVVLLGNLYEDAQYKKQQDTAFNIYYMGINVGAFFAPFAATGMRNLFLSFDKFYYDANIPRFAHNFIKDQSSLSADALVKFKQIAVQMTGNANIDLVAFSKSYLTSLSAAYNMGFAIAAVAIIVSFVIFLVFKKHYAHVDHIHKKSAQAGTTVELTPKQTKDRIVALVLVFITVIFFWMAFHQNGLVLTLFAKNYTAGYVSKLTYTLFDLPALLSLISVIMGMVFLILKSSTSIRRIIGMVLMVVGAIVLYMRFITFGVTNRIDPETFQAFNPIFVVFLTPVVIAFFASFINKGKEISSPRKIGYGMFIAALAYVLMVVVAIIGKDGSALDAPLLIKSSTGGSVSSLLVSPYWLISTYFTLTIAELFLSPMGLSFVAKVAPPKLKGLMQGGWLGATALGNYLSGVIAVPYANLQLWQTFALLVLTSVISGVFIFSVLKKLEASTTS